MDGTARSLRLTAWSVFSLFLILGMFGSPACAQTPGKIQVPEYFGVYALDNGKLTALIGGNSSESRGSQTVELFSFETNSSKIYPVLAFSSEIRFVVFDQASGAVA